jgi:antitoxin component of MazEF toxin-antitoxin module
MKRITRKVDAKGRVTLFGDFAGQQVIVERIGEDEIRLKRVKGRAKKYTLAQLLSGVTPAMIPPEVDFGNPQGSEVW